ncbi:LytTR family DNA-binding domain-containing protein [Sporomusa sp. GT1]|uniref:LytR/AlgR family response regulator transcription factor n=2 Tax=Sporomusa TaxID=2375 RepID=UPI001CB8535D|nr:LytTR family DNA-binding domain-containing protein [Sporomusa sp. GT1]
MKVKHMLKVLIVDDELPAREELRYLLSLKPEIEIAGEADNGAQAIKLATLLQPDVIFLDISMRDINGLEAAVILRKIAVHTMIVFATAYDEYAIKAFEIGAVDYILKPFEQERIDKTIVRLKNYQPEEWKAAADRIDAVLDVTKVHIHKLPVEKAGRIIFINYSDIIYAYASAGNAVIVTAGEELNYSGTLAELADRVGDTNILRVHKSYLANMDKVQGVVPWFKGTYWLKMEQCPQVEIPVSKSKIKEIKAILGLK